MANSSLTTALCSACGKQFAFSADRDDGRQCPFDGSTLRHSSLADGIYELVLARTSEAVAEATAASEDLSPERDLGFGPSHGCAVGHEGPTGPGDAPADVRPRGS